MTLAVVATSALMPATTHAQAQSCRTPSGPYELSAGEELYPWYVLTAPNGKFSLKFFWGYVRLVSDQNYLIDPPGGYPMGSVAQVKHVRLQTDGNLVGYDDD